MRLLNTFALSDCISKHIVCSRFTSFSTELLNPKFSTCSKSLWRVMFFGSDSFSVTSLTSLCKELKDGGAVTHLEVVTSKWMKNPVRLYGLKENLVVHSWPVSIEAMKCFDVGVVSSFGHLIPKSVIDIFPLGMLNIHGSLLPRWRGAAPVIYAIMHGDTETGITIMRVRPHRFDEGEIISTKKIPIRPRETAAELTNRLAEIGAQELMATLHRLPQCLEEAIPQPKEGVTYAPKVSPSLGAIDFQKMSALKIFNYSRALCHIQPLSTVFHGLVMRLYNISLHDEDATKIQETAAQVDLDHSNSEPNIKPGRIVYDKRTRTIRVQCCDGAFIFVGGIGRPPKKVLNAEQFYTGYLSKKPKESWFFGLL